MPSLLRRLSGIALTVTMYRFRHTYRHLSCHWLAKQRALVRVGDCHFSHET
jgi:hypothetical protein